MKIYQTTWHQIHDARSGWGYREHIPDNVIILSEYVQNGIHCKHIRSKQHERVIYARDVCRLFDVDLFIIPHDVLDCVYDAVQILFAIHRKNIWTDSTS